MNPELSLNLSALAERLGWTVLHSLWQGLAVAALLAVALRLLRNRSAAARHAACLLALAAMLAAMVVTAWESGPAFSRRSPATLAARLPVEGGRVTDSFTAPSQSPALPNGYREATSDEPPQPQTSAEGAVAKPAHSPRLGVTGSSLSARSAPAWRELIEPMLPWITTGWITGVTLLSLRHLGGWRRVRALRRSGLVPLPPALAQVAMRLAERLGLRRAVRVLASAHAGTPMLAGVLRPVVLLPARLATGLRPAELEAILAHELAHLARGDTWTNLLQVFAETVLFYHPAIWWIAHRARIERENAADDLAVRALRDDRLTYASALARLAEWEAAAQPPFALAASDGSLLTRIRRIVGQPAASEAAGAGWLVAAAALLAFAALLPLRAQDAPPTVRVAPGESIQAAIDAAAPGSVIQLGEGEWKERITISKPLTLEGAGWEKTRIQPDQLPPGVTPTAKATFMERFRDARPDEEMQQLHREYLEKFAPPTLLVRGAGPVAIRKLRVGGLSPDADGTAGGVLVAFERARAVMSDCAVVGPFSDGIQIAVESDVEIRRSLVAAFWGTGIFVEGRSGTRIMADDWRAAQPSRLHLIESELRGTAAFGVEFGSECDRSVIERCRISGTGTGIYYQNASPTIAGNTFSENGAGIRGGGRSPATVRGNLFWNNKRTGMECWFDSVDSIEGNTFVGNRQAAVVVMGGSKPVLARNLFVDSPTAISCGSVGEAGKANARIGEPALRANAFWRVGVPLQVMSSPKPAPEGSLSSDPQFRDPAKGDFALAGDSPARIANIGAAVPLPPNSDWPALPEESAPRHAEATAASKGDRLISDGHAIVNSSGEQVFYSIESVATFGGPMTFGRVSLSAWPDWLRLSQEVSQLSRSIQLTVANAAAPGAAGDFRQTR